MCTDISSRYDPRMAIAEAAGGALSWTDILTAIGMVGAVLVAVGIALWTDFQSGRRIKEERAHGRAQLEEERRLIREREQYAEATHGRLKI